MALKIPLDPEQEKCLGAHGCVVVFLLRERQVPVGHPVIAGVNDVNCVVMGRQEYGRYQDMYIVVDVARITEASKADAPPTPKTIAEFMTDPWWSEVLVLLGDKKRSVFVADSSEVVMPQSTKVKLDTNGFSVSSGAVGEAAIHSLRPIRTRPLLSPEEVLEAIKSCDSDLAEGGVVYQLVQRIKEIRAAK